MNKNYFGKPIVCKLCYYVTSLLDIETSNVDIIKNSISQKVLIRFYSVIKEK